MSDDIQTRLRALPAVNAVLAAPTLRARTESHEARVRAARAALDEAREALRGGAAEVPDDVDGLAARAVALLAEQARPAYRPVVNATGVVVHTNLGRAPLAPEAVSRVAAVAGAYSSLEYDLARGARGHRARAVEALVCELTGAEAALVVNNNAAAVYLALRVLALDREVLVSRGELVEIGGGFRIPDVLAASGARLVEVGTTNRTRLADYAQAISERTALILKVHRSNFAVVGFTEETGIEELKGLARRRGLPLVFDLGSGSLLDLAESGLDEPTPQAGLAAGADLVTFSGDKLLGGPQAGILLGRERLLARFRQEPMVRALRLDKMTLAALDATLRLLRDRAGEIPVLAMLRRSEAELQAAAEALHAQLVPAVSAPGFELAVVPVVSRVGGGALPLAELSSRAIRVTHPEISARRLEARLRAADPPVIVRIADDAVLLDVRTLLPGDADALRAGLLAARAGPP